jgi:hypothetical protein
MKWPAAVGGPALAGQHSIAPVAADSGRDPLSAVRWGSAVGRGLSMGSGGAEAAVGAAGQPPSWTAR